MKKELKKIVNVLSNCPAMYWQNIEHKSFKYTDYCIKQGHNLCGSFLNCPMWNKRIDCWKSISDLEDHFNEK